MSLFVVVVVVVVVLLSYMLKACVSYMLKAKCGGGVGGGRSSALYLFPVS
jgi:hypothetical protein